MNKLGNEARGNALSRIFGKFVDTTDHGSVNNNSASPVADKIESAIESSVIQLNELIAEKVKLQRLRTQETDKKESLDTQTQELESQRIEALTAHRIAGGEKDKQRADDLLKQIEQLKQNAMDATGIAGSIERKIAAIDDEINTADRVYRINLGKFFDNQMDNLVAEYNDLAPRFARIVTDIDALYRMMIQYGAGNSNGWWRDARAPAIKPRDGHIYPAIVDTTSAEFDDTARRRASEIIEAFKKAGFMWRHR